MLEFLKNLFSAKQNTDANHAPKKTMSKRDSIAKKMRNRHKRGRPSKRLSTLWHMEAVAMKQEGKTYRQIAETFDVSVDSVNAALAKHRKKMKVAA
jgi:DNA-binding NarL/FixJ family response regulator